MKLNVLPIAGLAVLMLGVQASAGTIFSDDFESYNYGVLDRNMDGTNAVNTDASNPWIGPDPSNNTVVGPSDQINPGITATAHGGSKMIRGNNKNDQDYVNISYKYNNGNAYTGGLQLDWWYYDPYGAGNSALIDDYMALAYYAGFQGVEYPVNDSGDLNTAVIGAPTQRLSLGTYNNTDYYMARVLGATGGSGDGSWFSTNVVRSAGWHEMRIVVGDALADGTNNVNFYIDNMQNPVLSMNSTTTVGYNVIEANNNMKGAVKDYTQGYFDDITLTSVPEPGSFVALAAGLVSLLGLKRRRN